MHANTSAYKHILNLSIIPYAYYIVVVVVVVVVENYPLYISNID